MEGKSAGTLFRSIGSKDKLVDRVAGEIQRMVLQGELPPDTKLPPEVEFAEQIGVSRTVLREALRALAHKGLLETRQGVGTIVRQPTVDQISEPLGMLLSSEGITLDHIHQVRTILELEIAPLAANQATEEDIEALRRLAWSMVHSDDVKEFADLDGDFHTTLAKMSQNPLLVVLLNSIRDVIQEVRLHVSGHPALRKTVIRDHKRLQEAVAARDPEAARQAMAEHLAHARKIQEEYLEQKHGKQGA